MKSFNAGNVMSATEYRTPAESAKISKRAKHHKQQFESSCSVGGGSATSNQNNFNQNRNVKKKDYLLNSTKRLSCGGRGGEGGASAGSSSIGTLPSIKNLAIYASRVDLKEMKKPLP